MDERPSSKRYEPPFINLNNKNNSHTLVVELAGINNLILEVGTSTGYMTKFLRDLGNHIIGVEIDEEAAEIASKYCDLMITGDVEELDLDEYLGPSSIDVVIFADVLEHLKYPAQVLKKIRRYLKPQGSIVISIPNICHGDVLLNLLEGDFKYTSMGLLDETHLRFFGLKNVVDLLNSSGYSITEIEATRLPVGKTELRRNLDEVPREIIKFIDALPNSDVYQFVFRATASENPKNPIIPEADLKEIFDRSIEGLLREHEQPLKCEIAEICSKHQVALERIVSMGDELQKAVERSDSLGKAVSERNGRITELSEELRKAVERSDSLGKAVSERDGRITELGEELRQAVERSDSLGKAVSERDGIVANLRDELSKSKSQSQLIEKEIVDMRRSIVWQLVMKYHNGFVEKVLPHGTGRRSKYDLALKGGRILVNEGWENLWWKFNDYRRWTNINDNSRYNINIPDIILIDGDEKIKKIINATVSVVIPTKNAGEEFEYLLNMLINQKGIREVEIVVVDSGSTDKTLDLAKVHGAKIIEIPPEKFSHSYARNLGFDNTKGEYVLFTVQDSLPPSQTWLYEFLTVMEKNDVAAVSCAEFPREDADLFYRAITWNHYRFLEVNENDRVFSMPERENYITIRKNGQLSDIACLIPKDTFKKYRYRLNYAEDLDLGMRLIKDGYKIAFLSSIRIIHSHNRPAYYFLKRGYVDNVFLSSIFTDFPAPSLKMSEVSQSIIITYNKLYSFIEDLDQNINMPYEVESFINLIISRFKAIPNINHISCVDATKNQYIDDNFKLFLEEFFLEYFTEEANTSNDSLLIDATLSFMEIIFDFMRKSYELIDDYLLEEFKVCIFKAYAILCGSYIAYCYLQDPEDEKLIKINDIFARGV